MFLSAPLLVIALASPPAPAEPVHTPLPSPDAPAIADPRLQPLNDEPTSAGVEDGTPLTVTLGTGYALRIHSDERFHGAIGRIAVDVPLWFGFGVRGEAVGYGWGPSPAAPRALALPQGAMSLVYEVDETPIAGLISIGAFAGWGLDVDVTGAQVSEEVQANNGLYAGLLFSVGVRWRLGATTQIELLGQLPVTVLEPTGVVVRAPLGTDRGGLFPFQPSLSVGLVFEPWAFVEGIWHGDEVWSLVAPAEASSFLDWMN